LGDLCELAGRDVGEIDEGSSVRKIITTATMAKTLASKSELKTLGSLSLRIATIVLARILLVPAPSKIFSISRAQVRCHIFIKNLRLSLKSDLQSGETLSRACLA
jgi:hypothetical protein